MSNPLFRRLFCSLGFGLSKVIAQKSLVTAICFAVGLLLSPWSAIGALVGLVFSTGATAFILPGKIDGRYRRDIDDGMYGYNGVLVGIAVLFYLGASVGAFILLVGGAVLSSFIQQAMLRREMASYTAPFVLATWAALIFANWLGLEVAPHVATFEPLPETWFLAPLAGIGQIMFQGATSGALFLVGVAGACGKQSLWLVVGAVAGAVVGLAFGQPEAQLNAGLFGFNTALTVFAVMTSNGKIAFAEKLVRAVVGTVVAVLLTMFFNAIHFPALTAPFVLSTWIASAEPSLLRKVNA